MAGIGHNSQEFGQSMAAPMARARATSQKAPKARFQYFKFYPRDWIEATRDMTLEARGAYIDLICLIMEMEGHLTDNDSWISHQMHVSTRKWRAVKKQLIGHEKIRIEDGKIVNERCLKELDSLLTQRRNLAESALNRERTKRENPEKPNENNSEDTTTVPLRARVLDLDLDSESDTSLRSVSAPASLGQDRDGGSPVDSDKLVWGKGIEWLSEASGQPASKLKPIVGRWLKTLTFDELLHAMRAAAKAKTGDPISYIAAIINSAKQAEHNVRREHGRIVVMNGFKAELETLLSGRDLQRTLDRIAGKIPIGVAGIELEAKVRSMAIEIVERVADQDRRYEKAKADNAIAEKPKGSETHAADAITAKYRELYRGVL